MGKVTIIALSLLVSLPLFAEEFGDDVSTSGEFTNYLSIEEVIIDVQYVNKKDWQEPFFSNPDENSRKVAGRGSRDSDESIGELEVQPEIPFTYPWMTHRVLQQRVLEKFEKHVAKKSK